MVRQVKRFLIIVAIMLMILWIVFKWVIPWLIAVIENLIRYVTGRFAVPMPSRVQTLGNEITAFSDRVRNTCLEILIVVLVIIAIRWLYEIVRGQVGYDLKAVGVVKKFSDPEATDAKAVWANRIIRRAYFRKRKGRRQLVFWGLTNSEVERDVLTRFNRDKQLVNYLGQAVFKGTTWLPLEANARLFGFITIYLAEEKR
ncbi:hypothetical protein [Limosilactobacillus fermentum]|uniref:hypothetical protein n=1 Tax=Limosilactobacillus fermentum TaxID=1613 RepID=UPI0005FB7D84|nr:hypothetical protein [Limosilactobacillus fermentum]